MFFGTSPEVVQLTVSTNDSTKNVTLADSSRVTLYKNSAIEFPNEFSKTREIKLVSGEAFFNIEKDSLKPFIVHAAFADIQVVGTQFNVIIRPNGVEVGVNEGMVLLKNVNDSVYIGQGAAAFVKLGETPRKARMDENTWAYATRKLIFKDTPMEEVIKAVEKTYSCSISVSNDNVNNCKLTATFERDSVDKIVLLISETLNLKLEHNGQVYTLEGDGCP
jgi:ferric-dicitrate binding protein FerR (iron transport regulator)